ncbi:MAG: hypothetical protein M9928_09210 [Anaerolineae bacterium]|nr:hypothetical protein [Anaerolineae bacterium]
MNPFDFETLLDYFDGVLSAEKAHAVEQWLATNPDSADVRWLQAFQALRQTVQLPTLRDETRETLVNQFEARRKPQTAQPALWQRLVAALTFDSHEPRFAAAMRATQTDLRQLVFTTEPVDISLDIAPYGNGWRLSGQLLFNTNTDDTRCAIRVLADDTEIALGRSDDFGEFVIDIISAAVVQLIITHAQFEVELPTINLAV